jgi:hypothetical protein
MNGRAIPKELFYARHQDGGLGLMILRERYKFCKLVNIIHLLSSEIGDIV